MKSGTPREVADLSTSETAKHRHRRIVPGQKAGCQERASELGEIVGYEISNKIVDNDRAFRDTAEVRQSARYVFIAKMVKKQ